MPRELLHHVVNWLPDWLIWFGGVLATAMPFLGILLAVHALMSARSSQGKVAWVIGLLSFPWVTSLLYGLVGRNRFNGYVDARQANNQRDDLEESMKEMRRALRDFQVPLAPDAPGSRDQRLLALERVSGLRAVSGNALVLYDNGEAAFAAMIEAIGKAQHTVLVEFFIVRADELGMRFADALIERAQAGVPVRFLYDEFGSWGLKRSFRRHLRQGGVQLHKFGGRRRPLTERFQLNFRNHRKIVVIDDEVAFLGGLNVGTEYLGKHPKLGLWRDTHLQVRGPAVEAVQMVYLEDWLWATGEVLQLPYRPLPEEQNETVLIVPTGPSDHLPAGQQLFLQLIESARQRLWIASPYFVPDEAVLGSLQGAALRGVDVRLLLPGVPDQKLVHYSSFSYYADLDRVGIKVWRFTKGFLHQKVIAVDDDLALVGTANLDNRSMFLNFEISALAVGGGFPQEVLRMLEDDFQHSRRVDLRKDWFETSMLFRLKCNFARLLGPVQ